MDRYIVSRTDSSQADNPKPLKRSRWKRTVAELDGKFSVQYRRQAYSLMLQSYSEIGAFPHLYHIGEVNCPTHVSRIINAAVTAEQLPVRREGISSLDFDSKGIYLASVTKSGCLTVHDFEALYCCSDGLSTCSVEDEGKHVIHLNANQQIDVVRWNLANQYEVGCTSVLSNEILIFDMGYVSFEPIEVLKKRPTITVHGHEVSKGLTDIAFSSIDESRLLASDMHGLINIWDRRVGSYPCVELTTDTHSPLNSIQLNVENQIVFGAGKHGILYAWDLRGGKTSVAFQSHKQAYYPPLFSLKLTTMLQNIKALKEQTDILPREIHSIDLDPSCPHQLAFHLDDGWSGVFNTISSKVTHIHCPSPASLNDLDMSIYSSYLRKPAWLPTSSIYAVGSSSDNGINLLDFYPDPISACHVDFNIPEEKSQGMRNVFIPLSERVTACTSHPLNGIIIGGTKQSSLLVISQMRKSYCSENQEMKEIKDDMEVVV